MLDPDGSPSSPFATTFVQRFAAAIGDARGAIAGIAASAEDANGALIDAATLGRLHEIYRLRVELEIETAGVLWRTAEIVSAMADVLALLQRPQRVHRPGRPQLAERGSALGRIPAAEVEARRLAPPVGEDPTARRGRWPPFTREAPFRNADAA